jgi:hypothetical protein
MCVCSHTQQEDRIVLVRAASAVVLRRDLSLSRRLFSWLLGPSESSEEQVVYFRKNGLDLLASSLKVRTLGSLETVLGLYMADLRVTTWAYRSTWVKHARSMTSNGRSRSSSPSSTSGKSVTL